MGCTSSKESPNPNGVATTADEEEILTDQFRQWLKSHRTQADQYVLQEISAVSSTPNEPDADAYRPIVRKALDLVSQADQMKSLSKLSKLLHKELPMASTKKIDHTVQILHKTAEKLRDGQIQFDTANGQVNESNRLEKATGQMSSGTGEPGIVLKQALETARILFYKGKQAAIFANPNGGYDVRILDEHDDVLKDDGNLLRSIIVTEVKMRPKLVQPPSSISSIAPPPPPSNSSKPLNEHQITDDFRRSIDAALKGLESIYHPPTPPISENISQPNIVDHNHELTNHNVTYTEIIRSESRDGEQSRRVKTESYEAEQPTTLKVLTKSEFSQHPSSGEKIMEQSVQVISVKVRNETTTTTSQQP